MARGVVQRQAHQVWHVFVANVGFCAEAAFRFLNSFLGICCGLSCVKSPRSCSTSTPEVAYKHLCLLVWILVVGQGIFEMYYSLGSVWHIFLSMPDL